MARWARTMIRFRWAVLAVWLVAFVAAGAASAGLSDLLTNRFVLPGSESDKARNVLQDHFGQKPEGSFSIVVKTHGGRRAGASSRRSQAAAVRAAKALPTGKVASVTAVSGDVVTATIVSSLDPADAKGHTDDMREAAGTIPGAELYVTGQAAIEHDLDPVMSNDLKVGELFIAIPIALLILIFVFGSLAFLLPFMLAAAAIPVTLGILWIFANFMELSTYLQNIVMLIGLGIAVDYSLLMVYRYREEHRAGRSREDAVVRTMETAGRAVVFSGTAVAIGLALMLAMPLPFMRGFGLAGLLIPLVSVLAAMTLLPVLLYWLEDRLDRVRLSRRACASGAGTRSAASGRASRGAIMRRPVLFATGRSLRCCSPRPIPSSQLSLTPGSNTGVPQNLEAVRGLNVLEDAVGAGRSRRATSWSTPAGPAARPTPPCRRRSAGSRRRSRPTRRSRASTTSPRGRSTSTRRGRTCTCRSSASTSTACRRRRTSSTGCATRSSRPPASRPASTVLAGGGPPGGVDFLDLTYGAFPWLVLAVLAAHVRAARARVPVAAAAAEGDRHEPALDRGRLRPARASSSSGAPASRSGIQQFDQIEGWIPVFLFAMLFGLSMDYEVFLVSPDARGVGQDARQRSGRGAPGSRRPGGS